MSLIERLHESEIQAEIRTEPYHSRPYHWQIRSPFSDRCAFGEALSVADAEAEMSKHAAKMFPDSAFVADLKGSE